MERTLDHLEIDADAIDQALAAGMTFPAAWYTDPEIHRIEVEDVFRQTWQIVCFEQRVKNPGESSFGDSFIGTYARNGAALRLKQRVEGIVNRGPWDVAVAANLQSRYRDYDGVRMVGEYETFDLALSYKGIKNVKINAGLLNMFDKKPPASNQNDYFQVGYDPANTNPRGRTLQVGAEYKFF